MRNEENLFEIAHYSDSTAKSNFKAVYLMEGDNGLVKIGISNDIDRRKIECEKKYHTKIKRIVTCFKCNHARYIEKELHDLLIDKWVYSEWFRVDMDYAIKKLFNIYLYHKIYVDGVIVKENEPVGSKDDIFIKEHASSPFEIMATYLKAMKNRGMYFKKTQESYEKWKYKNCY